MPMIMPPKEILKNVKCRNNSVYLVGEVTEEQKKIFRKFKKEVEDVLKKAELKQTDCLYINRKASQNIAQALCSVSFVLCGAFSYKVKKEKMIDMADQELFMIQDDTDEAYAKEHAEELAAEIKGHEKWFEDYIEKEKNKRNV